MSPCHAPLALAGLVLVSTVGGPATPLAPTAPLPHHPHDVVDDVDLTPTYDRDKTVFVASSGTMRLFLKSENGGYSWANARRGMRGSTVREFVVPTDWESSRTGYAVLGPHGLQRTTDGGASFHPLMAEYLTLLAMPEVRDGVHTLFFGGEYGLLRSDDGGETQQWLHLGPSGDTRLSCLAVSPNFHADGTVVVGILEGALKISRDGGEEWQAVAIHGSPRCVAFSPDYANDQTLWIATHEAGVLRSTDGGRTFAFTSIGMTDPDVNYLAVAPTYPECKDLYAATRDAGVYRSRDGGDTWQLTSLDPKRTGQTDNHFSRLALAPSYPADPTVFCGAYEGLYISHDAGEQWLESNMNPTRIGRKIQLSSNFEQDRTLFAATYGNPFMRSTDGGDSWTMESTNFRAISTYSIAPAPDFAAEQLVIAGTIGGVRRSEDGGSRWQQIDLPPVVDRDIYVNVQVRDIVYSPRFAEDRTVFAIHNAGVYVSTDAGVTWEGREAPSDWPWVFEVSPGWPEDRLMFAAGLTLHRSTDDGNTWSDSLFENRILDIKCAPDFVDSGEVYALSQTYGFLRSTDRGVTWEVVEGALDGFGAAALRLSPDFSEDQTIYASTLGGGMFMSRDRGITWQRWTELGSPVDACFVFALSPGYQRDGTVFAGTFDGIWRSTDRAQTWELITTEEFYDEARAPWLLHGDEWQKDWYPKVYGRCVMKADRPGHEATLPFVGTGVRVYGARGPDHGKAEVLVNGVVVGSMDLFHPRRQSQYTMYENFDLPWGVHDVTVRVLGEKRDAATGAWVSIDAGTVHYVAPRSGPTPVYTNAAQLRHMAVGTVPRELPRPADAVPKREPAHPITSLVALLMALGVVVVLWRTLEH